MANKKSWKDKFLSSFMEESDEQIVVDPNKELGEQIKGKEHVPFTVMNVTESTNYEGTNAEMPAELNNIVSQFSEEDKNLVQARWQEIYQQQNVPGPSYHEYINMVETMSGSMSNMDLYPKIFEGYVKQGMDFYTLIESAKKTYAALVEEKNKYNQAVEEKRANEILSKKNEVDSIGEQIRALQQKQQQMIQEVREEEVSLNQKAALYNKIGDIVINKVQKDIESINQYISH